jgi:peptide/nickel transport system ATP-binding protein
MRQRVMIAMALALEPRIVIMDEPTTALDVVTQREILEELMELRDRLGFSILFITHDLSLLVEIAGARQLYRAPRHPYSLGLLSSFPGLHGPRRPMTGIGGSPPDLSQLPAGCVFHPRCPYVMDRCRTDSPPLRTLPGGGRTVACWLQDGTTAPPPELALPESGAAAPAGEPISQPPAALPPAALPPAATSSQRSGS